MYKVERMFQQRGKVGKVMVVAQPTLPTSMVIMIVAKNGSSIHSILLYFMYFSKLYICIDYFNPHNNLKRNMICQDGT